MFCSQMGTHNDSRTAVTLRQLLMVLLLSAERYAVVLESMASVTLEGLIMAVRRQSQVGRLACKARHDPISANDQGHIAAQYNSVLAFSENDALKRCALF